MYCHSKQVSKSRDTIYSSTWSNYIIFNWKIFPLIRTSRRNIYFHLKLILIKYLPKQLIYNYFILLNKKLYRKWIDVVIFNSWSRETQRSQSKTPQALKFVVVELGQEKYTLD